MIRHRKGTPSYQPCWGVRVGLFTVIGLMTEMPEITQDKVDSVFGQLAKMEVQLDDNPLAFGPRRLNEKISYARGMLTDCERIFLQISHHLQKYRSAHRAASVALDLEKKNLFANDPEVRAGRNYNDRDAMASMKLRDQVEFLAVIQSGLDDLETLLTVIKAKRSDLKDIQGRIRDQIKLCQEEIGLGSRWGSRLPPGSSQPNLDSEPPTEKTTLRDLQDLFSGDGVVSVVENTESPDSLEAAFSTNSAESDAFLDGIGVEPRNSVQDLDDLLKDFNL